MSCRRWKRRSEKNGKSENQGKKKSRKEKKEGKGRRVLTEDKSATKKGKGGYSKQKRKGWEGGVGAGREGGRSSKKRKGCEGGRGRRRGEPL